MYKVFAGGFLLFHGWLFNWAGKTEITLGDFIWVIAIALIGAGLDTMENKKKN